MIAILFSIIKALAFFGMILLSPLVAMRALEGVDKHK